MSVMYVELYDFKSSISITSNFIALYKPQKNSYFFVCFHFVKKKVENSVFLVTVKLFQCY